MAYITPPRTEVKDNCVVCKKPIVVVLVNKLMIKKYCSEECRAIAGAVRKVEGFLHEKGLSFAKLEKRIFDRA